MRIGGSAPSIRNARAECEANCEPCEDKICYNTVMSLPTTHFDMPLSFALPSTLGPHRAADYWKLPEGEPVELIKGNLVMSPAPNPQHQVISMLLSEIVLRASRSGGGFGVASPIDVVLSDDTVLQPDLIYVSRQRRSIVGKRVDGPPDLAIEIISQSNAVRDRTHKMALYAEYGVAEYWIVDPTEKHIEFLLLQDGHYRVETLQSSVYTSPRLPELTIDLAPFWAEVERMTSG